MSGYAATQLDELMDETPVLKSLSRRNAYRQTAKRWLRIEQTTG
jgi:hypothetical protein